MPGPRISVSCLVLSLSILGCTSSDNSAKSDPKPTPAEPEAKPATPEAKPATPEAKPATPEAKPATPEAKPQGPTSAFAFEQVFGLERRVDEGGDLWMISTRIELTEAQERLLHGEPFDPAKEGLDPPYANGQEITLVTPDGVLRQKITSFEAHRTMNDDLLAAVLGPATGDDKSGGVAIVGAVQPVATAKMRSLESEPPSPELLAELATEFEGASTKLIADFEPIDDPDEPKPKPATLTPEAGCVTVHRPNLPAGFDAIVTIACGLSPVYEPKLAATFLVGPGKRQAMSQWSIGYGTSTLDQVVDLDGDGIDELVITESGYEYYNVSYLGWNGSEYAPLPGSTLSVH